MVDCPLGEQCISGLLQTMWSVPFLKPLVRPCFFGCYEGGIGNALLVCHIRGNEDFDDEGGIVLMKMVMDLSYGFLQRGENQMLQLGEHLVGDGGNT